MNEKEKTDAEKRLDETAEMIKAVGDIPDDDLPPRVIMEFGGVDAEPEPTFFMANCLFRISVVVAIDFDEAFSMDDDDVLRIHLKGGEVLRQRYGCGSEKLGTDFDAIKRAMGWVG